MKYFLFILCINGTFASAQITEYPFRQLYQLDSIGKSNSISKHFGKLYFTFLGFIEAQLAPADPETKRLVRRFEAQFAQFFIDAAEDYKNNKPIAITDWQAYFRDSTLLPIQYKLLGTNAHLNGRLWEAHARSFTLDQMNSLKKEFVIFKKSLNATYRIVYDDAGIQSKKSAFLKRYTIGVDKLLGYFYLYKWRKRQTRLARYFLANSPKFTPLLARVNKRRQRLDSIIFKWK